MPVGWLALPGQAGLLLPVDHRLGDLEGQIVNALKSVHAVTIATHQIPAKGLDTAQGSGLHLQLAGPGGVFGDQEDQARLAGGQGVPVFEFGDGELLRVPGPGTKP